MSYWKYYKFYEEHKRSRWHSRGDWVYVFYEFVRHADGEDVVTWIECVKQDKWDTMIVDFDARGTRYDADDKMFWHSGRLYFTKHRWIKRYFNHWRNFTRRKKAARKIQQFLLEVIYRPGGLGFKRLCTVYGNNGLRGISQCNDPIPG